jgi:xanthine dehydrogenase accessory factor
MRSIYHNILEEIRAGTKNVLATVIETAGSTPQKPGSSALFGEAGLLAGTVGGGPLEDEVQHIAESLMITGFSDYFYFNMNDEPGSDGAICGGEARVLVDAEPSANLSALVAMEDCLSRHEGGFLLTVVSKKFDQGRSIKRYWINGPEREHLPEGMDTVFKDLILKNLQKAEQEGFISIDLNAIPDHQVKMAFLEHIKPMPHLLIVGGGHVGKALAHLGSLLEFEISVLDDRDEYASKENIPDADHLIVSEVGAALQKMKPGPESYIVIVTRGHRLDGDALKACIGSEAAYIGMIGSRNKVALMKKQFLEEGWATPEQWESIHTPIGLSIGSVTVQEIAVSIAAQLIEVRNRRPARHG